MKRPVASYASIFWTVLVWFAGVPPLAGAEVQLNGHRFTLPDGFEIERIAGPPLVDRPIVADFDEQGRLYVAESSGTNDPVQEQLAEKPHRILRLEDTDGDGRFDTRTVFADHMMFPEGAMWLDGSIYVSAPPSIWRLTDTDGDGVADQRHEWFEGKTLTGCANDLHGPYRGPEGWIYWCKGAFAEQTYERPGGKSLVTRAAHIFRCRPDGTGIEPVMTGGMDNPVDVVFTPGGERIFTTTFFQHPGGGQRDGLIHAIYGGVYGKVHNVIDDHTRTSPHVMPVLTHLGPAAPCGLTHYDSDVFGADYTGNLFAALFNMQKITRHVLTPEGATFTTRDEDFLVSSNKDFHPTDVLADADGSLIVIDTGGWYKLCCPTSQLWKPDVLGGIYRIRRSGGTRHDDPRGIKIHWTSMGVDAMIELLDDRRPAVRERAIATLASLPVPPTTALTDAIGGHRSILVRRNAVWTAARIDRPEARAAVRDALRDVDETVRQAAIHAISVSRDREAVPGLLEVLRSESYHNRRAAAEALGRLGDSAAVEELLAAATRPYDRVLEHSLTYALIEIGGAEGLMEGLQSTDVQTRKAALVALDQLGWGHLAANSVGEALGSEDASLREVALWIAGRHPEWGEALAGVLGRRLSDTSLSMTERQELEAQLARLSSSLQVQQLLVDRVRDPTVHPMVGASALRAMAGARLSSVPDTWVEALGETIAGDGDLVWAAIDAAGRLELDGKTAPELVRALVDLAKEAGLPTERRVAALAAIPRGATGIDDELFAWIRALVSADQPNRIRALASEALARAALSDSQLVLLAQSLRTVSPLEMDRLLAVLESSSDERLGLQIVTSLGEAESLASLRTETLRPRLERFGDVVQQEAERLYAQLEIDSADQLARLERLLTELPAGDVRRGQSVFNGTKGACASCHAIGYLGGDAGPDLTRIGRVRSERDLLESIVFPSASFVRSYEPITVLTTQGKFHNGLLRQDSPEEIVLTLGADQDVRIPRDEAEEIRPGTVSIMPAGLDQQLTLQELADLVAFLAASR